MPRSLWTGSLGFGLVNVPVKIVSAVKQKEIRFHQVHEADGGRIRYKRVCEVDGEEVDYDEIAKVTAEGGGPPVLVTKEELDEVEAEKDRLIEILDFVRLEQVDPLYFEKPYYLMPDEGGAKAYRLLVDAMDSQGMVAVARFVFRTKEKLVLVRVVGDALTLTTLNYGDEVVLPEDLEGLPGKTKLPKREVEMAEQLIQSLATDFDPMKYRDEHRERVLDLLEAKREGGILLPTPKGKTAATTDLADALKQSLEAARKGRKAEG